MFGAPAGAFFGVNGPQSAFEIADIKIDGAVEILVRPHGLWLLSPRRCDCRCSGDRERSEQDAPD